MNRVLVPTLTAAGLLGGYWAARASGVRAAGGAVLALVGAGVCSLVARRSGAVPAVVVTTSYLVAFGGSHPLAKRLDAWPAVLVAAGVAAVPAALLG